MRQHSLTALISLLSKALLLLPTHAYACSVCYGDPNSNLSRGLNMGVLVLLLVTAGVLAVFAYFIFSLRRRAKLFPHVSAKE
jgi:heme/copper-type cytochrome/quinol oxidase subunit 2